MDTERVAWISFPFFLFGAFCLFLTLSQGCCNKGTITTEVTADFAIARNMEAPNEEATHVPAEQPQELQP